LMDWSVFYAGISKLAVRQELKKQQEEESK
jgi:hypothetical protein